MNVKKYLQKQAEKDALSLITEEDELFIQQLIEKDRERDMKENNLNKKNDNGKKKRR